MFIEETQILYHSNRQNSFQGEHIRLSETAIIIDIKMLI